MIGALAGMRASSRRSFGVGSLFGVVVLLASGCSNPFSPEGTDPGVYKGAPDALFGASADERDEALRERLELIQNR